MLVIRGGEEGVGVGEKLPLMRTGKDLCASLASPSAGPFSLGAVVKPCQRSRSGSSDISHSIR